MSTYFAVLGFIVSSVIGFKGCTEIIFFYAEDTAIYATFSSLFHQLWKALAPLLFFIGSISLGTYGCWWLGNYFDESKSSGSTKKSRTF